MESRGKHGPTLVVLLAVLLSFAAFPVVAVEHNDSETWTYEVSTSFDVGIFVVDVTGNVTYEFAEKRTITVDAREYDVNVVRVKGELSGTMDLFGEPFLEASVAIDGFLYETANGGGIVEDDAHWLLSATSGSGSAAQATQYETKTVVNYTPPYLSELDPESVELGVQWSEAVSVSSTVTTWENGTIKDVSSGSSTATYDIEVESATDPIVTPIGTFDAIRITVIDESGDYEVRWWSDDVNGYVMIQSFSEGDDSAHESMLLTSYDRGVSESMLWVAMVGVAAAVAAILALAVVLFRMRHPKGS